MTRARYGAFHDGPDPLADPVDAASAVDAVAERILGGQSVAEAVRDLVRQGAEGMRGLRDLRAQARRRRRELERSGRLDGTLERVRELLDAAVEAERRALFPDPSDDARLREGQLDGLPAGTAAAVRELRDYAWRSPEAASSYAAIEELLRRDVVDSAFRDLTRALGDPGDPSAREALRDMLADLNAMMAKHRRGEDVAQDFADFMARHGEAFPERPESFEQLLDELARRAAATQRLLDSLTPDQREQLAGLMEQTLSDLDLASEMAQLTDHLRALRPDLPWQGRARMDGDEGMSMPDATGALADLADLESLDDQLGQGYPGATLDDVDEDAVRRALGRQAVDDVRRLQEVERRLVEEGYLVGGGERVELTPKAMRRLGQAALRQVFAEPTLGGRGDHDVRETGASGELTGSTRAWQFGDDQPVDVVRTVGNAVRRSLAEGRPASGSVGNGAGQAGREGRRRPGVRLSAEDFEVAETETRTRAAVALLVDQSFSMVMNDTWRAAKTTALALHSLATTQFPLDAVQVIAFANLARVIAPHELADLDANDIQGTNLQHALMLAGRFLDRHRDAEPVVLVVTDGEPTAHVDRHGEWWFSWPPSDETVTLTVAEVDRLTVRGVPISWFRLGDDPRLATFLDDMARRNGGRVLAATGDRLGSAVVADYVRRRRSPHRPRR